jgi:hypothetical protein
MFTRYSTTDDGMNEDFRKLLGKWTGARIAFPSESAGAEPWSGPFDHAAPVRTPATSPYVGPQHEMDLPPSPPVADQH